jgi:hypothetical protein
MPKPEDGFKVNLPELESIAVQHLPAVANALRGPATVVLTHEGLEGPGQFDPVYAMERAYAHFTDSVGIRQRTGCDRIDQTAQALKEIVDLYRRADGQA